MSEVKKEIVWYNSDTINVNQLEGFLIEDKHTIADITRLIISEKWDEEVLYFLTEGRSDL